MSLSCSGLLLFSSVFGNLYKLEFCSFKSTMKYSGRKNAPKTFLDHKGERLDVTYCGKSVCEDIELNGCLFRVWHPNASSDEQLISSLKRLSKLPGLFPYVAVMPDYHPAGRSLNGSVIASEEAIYPELIGEDIGCGIASLQLPFPAQELEFSAKEIAAKIRERVPVGRSINKAYDPALEELELFDRDNSLLNRSNRRSALQQFGTLGSGNHFIELQANLAGKLNLMVHTGSRSLGAFIKKKFHRASGNAAHQITVIESESDDGKEYLKDSAFAVDYATHNRLRILNLIYDALCEFFPELEEVREDVFSNVIDVPHNQITPERHFGRTLFVHRKGAMRLQDDALGVIPGSMGTTTYLVSGRGNHFSFQSSSHGAGRRMSRGLARKVISQKELAKELAGIEARTDQGVIDEAPRAYKDIHKVMSYQKDLVKMLDQYEPKINVKG